MLYESWLAEREMGRRVRQEHAKADSRRLVRLLRRQTDQGLSWRLRWMMCGLGLRLVALGARIEAQFLPPAESVGRRAH